MERLETMTSLDREFTSRRSSVPDAPSVGRRARGPRIALYSHDTMGLGHARRNSLIAQSLANSPLRASVLLLAGAKETSVFASAAGIDCVTLPALQKLPDGRYAPRSLDVALPELIAMRSAMIEAALEAFRPDCLIVDKAPRGAVGELDRTLESLRLRGEARCVLGLRDVLDEPGAVEREWAASDADRAIRDYYDAVWIYGDPNVYDLRRECRLGPDMLAKTRFTGYFDRRTAPIAEAPESNSRSRHALLLVGGGQDGADLALAFAEAELPPGMTGTIIAGPFMPHERFDHLRRNARQRRDLDVQAFVPDVSSWLHRSDCVIAMGGYNTVSEVLCMEKRALLVPRIQPRQEQWIRARRLAEMGLVDVLHPHDVSPAALSSWLGRPPSRARSARQLVDFSGLDRLPTLTEELLSLHDAARHHASQEPANAHVA